MLKDKYAKSKNVFIVVSGNAFHTEVRALKSIVLEHRRYKGEVGITGANGLSRAWG